MPRYGFANVSVVPAARLSYCGQSRCQQNAQDLSLGESIPSPHGPEAWILTLAKYKMSQVRSHCAAAKPAEEKRHMVLKMIDESIVEGEPNIWWKRYTV